MRVVQGMALDEQRGETMTNVEEEIVDLKATVDYIADKVTERADTFEFEDNVALRDALADVIEEAKKAQALLETTMLSQLEAGVRQIGSRLFKRKRNMVKRFRHDLIAAQLLRTARAEATNSDGETSVTKALDIVDVGFRKLYVSPSTQAKVTAFDAYGIDAKAVTDYEDKGWKVEVEELDPRKD